MGSVPAYSAYAAVSTVTAGLTLATISVPSGAYACSYMSYFGPTSGSSIGSGEQENIALQTDPVTVNAFVTADLMLTQPIVNAPLVAYHYLVYAQSVIKLVAVGNATAGTVIYHVLLSAVLPGPSGSFL